MDHTKTTQMTYICYGEIFLREIFKKSTIYVWNKFFIEARAWNQRPQNQNRKEDRHSHYKRGNPTQSWANHHQHHHREKETKAVKISCKLLKNDYL